MAAYSVSGKVALVTGGARGIGFATAQALQRARRERGDRRPRPGRVGRGRRAARRGHALGIGADVTDRGAMQRAVATTVERFGGLDIVMANAGIANKGATLRAMSTRELRPRRRGQHHGRRVHGRGRAAGDRAPPRACRRRRLDLRVHERHRRDPLRDEQGRRRAAGPRAARRAGAARRERERRVLRLHRHRDGAPGDRRGPARGEDDGDPPQAPAQAPDPPQAGEAVARGIEERKPRIIVPRRWAAFSTLRGIVNPLFDAKMVRDAKTQTLLAELDQRAGEEQPTTASAR